MTWQEQLNLSSEQVNEIRTLGYFYVKQGLYDFGITIFEALILISKDNPYDYYMLGTLYLEKGQNLLALEHLDRAYNYDQSNPNIIMNRIKALLFLGYKNQALNQLSLVGKSNDKKLTDEAEALYQMYS